MLRSNDRTTPVKVAVARFTPLTINSDYCKYNDMLVLLPGLRWLTIIGCDHDACRKYSTKLMGRKNLLISLVRDGRSCLLLLFVDDLFVSRTFGAHLLPETGVILIEMLFVKFIKKSTAYRKSKLILCEIYYIFTNSGCTDFEIYTPIGYKRMKCMRL